MEKQTIAVLIQLGVFIAFNTFMWLVVNENKPKRGFLDSISDSVKVLKGFWVGLFSLFVLGLAAPLAVFLEVNGLFFIPMLLLIVLAATPLLPALSKNKDFVVKHIIGATGSIVSALVVIWVVYGHWWGIPLVAIAAIVLQRPKIKVVIESPKWTDPLASIAEETWSIKGFNYILLYARPVKHYTTFLEFSCFGVIALELLIR